MNAGGSPTLARRPSLALLATRWRHWRSDCRSLVDPGDLGDAAEPACQGPFEAGRHRTWTPRPPPTDIGLVRSKIQVPRSNTRSRIAGSLAASPVQTHDSKRSRLRCRLMLRCAIRSVYSNRHNVISLGGRWRLRGCPQTDSFFRPKGSDPPWPSANSQRRARFLRRGRSVCAVTGSGLNLRFA